MANVIFFFFGKTKIMSCIFLYYSCFPQVSSLYNVKVGKQKRQRDTQREIEKEGGEERWGGGSKAAERE